MLTNLILGYMWLFIHRPFEVWPILGTARIELVYALVLGTAWLSSGPRTWTPSFLHYAYLIFFGCLIITSLTGATPDNSYVEVDRYAKMLYLYIVLVTCVKDEAQLYKIVCGFLIIMALYMSHSLVEFVRGRHEYRMGTARMMGVDSSFSNPNSFASTILYAMPFISPIWLSSMTRRRKLFLTAYIGLSLACLILTGSRRAFAGLLFYGGVILLMSRHRFRVLAALLLLSPLVWTLIPASIQNRFLTLYDPSYGPRNAQESAEQRVEFLEIGLRLFSQSPIVGFGPGSFIVVSGTGYQPHQLEAQILSEMGLVGVFGFGAVLAGFLINHLEARRLAARCPWLRKSFSWQVNRASMVAVAVLLFMGLAGHNLYRYQWVWFGAFQILALRCLRDFAAPAGVNPQPSLINLRAMAR